METLAAYDYCLLSYAQRSVDMAEPRLRGLCQTTMNKWQGDIVKE